MSVQGGHHHPAPAVPDHGRRDGDPQEVRDDYRKSNIKIKFDYAVISADDLRKTSIPRTAILRRSSRRMRRDMRTRCPKQRKITYFAFTPNEIPGGVPQPTQQEIQATTTSTRRSTRLRSRRARGTS